MPFESHEHLTRISRSKAIPSEDAEHDADASLLRSWRNSCVSNVARNPCWPIISFQVVSSSWPPDKRAVPLKNFLAPRILCLAVLHLTLRLQRPLLLAYQQRACMQLGHTNVIDKKCEWVTLLLLPLFCIQSFSSRSLVARL